MQLAKVIGTVVATRKEDSLVGFKLLVLEPLDRPGARVVAVDMVGAGGGDTVLVVSGGGARAIVKAGTPVDTAIVGIVDSMDVRS